MVLDVVKRHEEKIKIKINQERKGKLDVKRVYWRDEW